MKTINTNSQDGIATLTFDEPGSPVNTMCEQWQHDLTEATAQVVKDKDAIKGILLASAKSTFFAGADLKGTMRLQPSDAPQVFREIEQTKKNFRTLETLGKPVVSLPERHGAGRRLGSGAGRPLPHRGGRPEDPVRPAGDHAGPDPRRVRHHQDDAPARPDGRAALHPGEQAVPAARSAGAGPGARAGARRRGAAPRGAGLDRKARERRRTRAPAVGRQELQDARRHAGQPEDRGHADRGAGHAEAEDARPVPRARIRAGRHGRRRAGRLRHRAAHRVPLPRQADRQPGGEEHDQHVLLQHERDQVGPVAAEGRPALQAAEGRHPRRRHDGRRHRLRPGQPRHRHGAEGRLAGQGRGRQGLQREDHAAARRQGPDEPARPGRPARAHHAHRVGRRTCAAAT